MEPSADELLATPHQQGLAPAPRAQGRPRRDAGRGHVSRRHPVRLAPPAAAGKPHWPGRRLAGHSGYGSSADIAGGGREDGRAAPAGGHEPPGHGVLQRGGRDGALRTPGWMASQPAPRPRRGNGRRLAMFGHRLDQFSVTAVEARSHLAELHAERGLALTTGVADIPSYMADLDEEIAAGTGFTRASRSPRSRPCGPSCLARRSDDRRAGEHLLHEGDDLGSGRIDQVAAAHQHGAGVRKHLSQRLGRFPKLGPRLGGRHQQGRLIDGGKRRRVGLQPPFPSTSARIAGPLCGSDAGARPEPSATRPSPAPR